jgi:hypothetical protein
MEDLFEIALTANHEDVKSSHPEINDISESVNAVSKIPKGIRREC